MGKLREIVIDQVFGKLAEGKRVYMITEITKDTPLGHLQRAGGFVYMEPTGEKSPEEIREMMEEESEKIREEVTDAEAPESKSRKPKSIVDHDKIIALRKAGWSIKEIADEVDASEQTVRNHLKQEAGD